MSAPPLEAGRDTSSDAPPVDYLARVAALAPLITGSIDEIERDRRLPPPLLDAMLEAGLFRLLVPRPLDGGEIDPVGYVRVIEAVARLDASTAWCLCQTAVCGMVGAYLAPEPAWEVFGRDPRAVLAWGAGPGGRATMVEGGYRVTGTWPFASGGHHATWIGGHCTVLEPDGAPATAANGAPVVRTMLFPAGQVAMGDNWNVIGLKGTGSDTYTLTDLFVPEDCAIAHHALDPAERREHGALYSFNIYQLFGAAFPAIALGIARAMLDAFIALAQVKTPAVGKMLLRDHPVIQSQVGVAESQFAAARTFFYAAWDDIWRAAQEDAVTLAMRVRLRMASIHASQQARQIADTAYLAAGATAVLESNPFERRFRDMHAVSQQAQAQFAIFEVIGRHFLGVPADSSRFF